ncbi:PrsW family intramembrane metalloprotease [Paractinoplanes abujensis]|uniref:RsiW-degrading membrane proteinase PrsW (M82 family) n=1 Tax=Paractinoplanes abujensis TaxID=882441 RepID=A0A7W7CYP3_9ACTN|nr:PrsW family intramembrane metalloprotease [Actinoplanes abujensis]MBB4695945.1 RsiW-degrading membrane proteinase PrsW (M82 family) [Actinoplanes abujensis]
MPAFWVVATLLAAGGLRMAQMTGHFFTAYPKATTVAILLFALLAVPFWLFVSELDFLEREPPELLVLAFAWGGLVATTVSIPGGVALENLMAKLGSPDLAADWGAAVAGPTVEEIAKTLGVVAIVLIARSQVNSVLDGVVYGAMVGLGFQIAEDVVFAVGAVALAGQGDQVQPVIATFLLRGFLAGIWSHTLFGALAGAGIGYLVVGRSHRIAGASLAVLGAWAFHVLWNSPLLADGLGNGPLALLGVLLIKGLPPLLLILLLVRHFQDREADYYVERLARLDDPSLITAGELTVLGSASRRAAARRLPGASTTVRRLQRAQARLAVELSRADAGSIVAAEEAVRNQRAALRRLGHTEAVGSPVTWRHRASTIATTAVAIAVLWVALSALGGA